MESATMAFVLLATLDLAFLSVKWSYKIPFPEFPSGSHSPIGGGRGSVGAAGTASRSPRHHRSPPSPGGLGDLGIKGAVMLGGDFWGRAWCLFPQ